jgi:glycerol uptake facilitator protein
MTQFFGEFFGTMLLIILGCGVNAGTSLNGSYSKGAGWMAITIGWALAVVMSVYLAGQASGAHLNPAVTLALAATGQFKWEFVPVYIIGQMLGAILGAAIVYVQYLPHWAKTDDPSVKLGVFSTGPAIPHTTANFASEFIGGFVLMLGLSAIGANEFSAGLNPLAVGGLIAAIGISLGGSTGYAINPARDLGPRIAHFFLPIAGKGDSNWGYAWLPVVAPILGGIAGAGFYQLFFK